MDDRLSKYIRLAEIGSYTKAAAELHISQPALSMAMQKLESELGTGLFIRNGKKLELTSGGEAVYRAAIEHHDIDSHLRETLNRLQRKRPSVTIGLVDSIAAVLSTSAAFERLEGRADVTLIVNNSRYLRESVGQRRADVAFVISDGLDHQNVYSTSIGNERLVLVCHPDDLKTVTSDIEQGSLRNFISYDKPSTTYRHIHSYFTGLEIRTNSRLYSTSPEVMVGMVLGGKGCAVLPEGLVSQYIEKGHLRVVLDAIPRPIALITPTNKRSPEYLHDFTTEAQQLLAANSC